MRVLTGIQPSGILHLGNYFGSIKQMLEYQEKSELFMFVANYHALTSLKDAQALRQNSIEAATCFLALGIDPEKTVFWLQSDVKEVLELYWILSNYTPMGLLERAHSYKDKISKGISPNHGLFSYPVLMAADILLYDSNLVPVGKDQIQHVEIARDIALKFNNECSDVLKLPEAKIDEKVATVCGTDGAKMSKSYKNTIDIFSNEKTLKKQISKIVTDSTALEKPKDWKNCNIFKIASLFLDENEKKELANRYEKGGEGYGHFKQYLQKIIWEYFEPNREKFAHLKENTKLVEEILDDGAKKAQKIASEKMKLIREAVGIRK